MESLLLWSVIIIVAIGVIVAGAFGLIAFASLWWLAIPIICACIGGWLGFFFGLGLVVIIGAIITAFKK